MKHSQFMEDARTLELVAQYNPPRFFLEIGAGHNGENNTHCLVDEGWDGVWIDARGDELFKFHRPGLRIVKSFVTLASLPNLLEGVPEEFGVFSLDVDGNDYHFWKAVCTKLRPWICIIECNMHTPGNDPYYIAPYRPAYEWDQKSRDHGASQAAMMRLGELLGYKFVGMCSKTPALDSPNAFFVRADVAR